MICYLVFLIVPKLFGEALSVNAQYWMATFGAIELIFEVAIVLTAICGVIWALVLAWREDYEAR